jgi:hypothetical protein
LAYWDTIRVSPSHVPVNASISTNLLAEGASNIPSIDDLT